MDDENIDLSITLPGIVEDLTKIIKCFYIHYALENENPSYEEFKHIYFETLNTILHDIHSKYADHIEAITKEYRDHIK